MTKGPGSRQRLCWRWCPHVRPTKLLSAPAADAIESPELPPEFASLPAGMSRAPARQGAPLAGGAHLDVPDRLDRLRRGGVFSCQSTQSLGRTVVADPSEQLYQVADAPTIVPQQGTQLA